MLGNTSEIFQASDFKKKKTLFPHGLFYKVDFKLPQWKGFYGK